MTDRRAVRRGRPRNPAIDASLLECTVRLLAERGFEATTVDAVALACGITRATVYRRFPNKYALVEAAVEALLAQGVPQVEPGANPVEDIRALLHNTADLLTETAFGPVFRALIPHLSQHPQLAALAHSMGGRRRAALRDAVQRAQSVGAIARDINVELAIDGVVGAIYFRYLIVGRSLDSAYVRGVFDVFLRAAATGVVPADELDRESPAGSGEREEAAGAC
ncbi:MAG: TetR/AcrR family transcriptional regulator [Pseudomonadota bacterium]